MNWLRAFRQFFSHRAFLLRRVARYTVAESVYLFGNCAPGRIAVIFWRAALALNLHHVPAALNRAMVLESANDAAAWSAFLAVVRAIENPQHTSASDLALTWVPGRWARRLAQRILWCTEPSDYLMEIYDRWNQDSLAQLAQRHFAKQLAEHDWARARFALDVWDHTRPNLATSWAKAEVEFQAGNVNLTVQHAAPLVEQGRFVSPLDAIRWAERWLAHNLLDLAEACLRWANEWTPELPQVWTLLGRLASMRGQRDEARLAWQRALALNPEDIDTFLALWSLNHATPLVQSLTLGLRVQVPESMRVGAEAQLVCALEGAHDGWEIHVLSSAGWGIVAIPRHQSVDTTGRCVFTLRACRPHRIRGEPWTLHVVAVSTGGFTATQARILVPDDTPGQVLVVSTEDHEMHEERGLLSYDDLRRLFIDKSKTAATRLHPLTQMVEVGSTLAMLDWAAEHVEAWRSLRDEARVGLVKSVAEGGDIQPHLHAFNDPRSPDFPYHVSPQGWSPNLKFLLTAEERRRDFAKAFSPRERIARIEEAVALIENIGRMGDPDYRAVLWRTGQLEFGSDAADRAWSAVALLRAGLLADSDIPRPSRPFSSSAPEAFFAGIDEPYAPRRGGQLLQLPVWGNLEGDYLTDTNALKRLVKRTFAQLRQGVGSTVSGVHLFTLLTHDKFINARRSGDEFRLDADYGDWATMRQHLEAWKREGAAFVTAREGIERLIDDRGWRLAPMLGEETFSADKAQVRYTLRLLGKGIPASVDYQHHLLIAIPPFLRTRVLGARVSQDDRVLPVEWNRADCFWVVVSQTESAIYCYFDLRPVTKSSSSPETQRAVLARAV